MAQSGFTPLAVYHSSTPGNLPIAGNLQAGELALNTADGKLYFKNASNVVTLLADAALGVGVTSFNTRTGAITLLSADVTSALGYTPANAASILANNVAGGAAGKVLYQTGTNTTGFTPAPSGSDVYLHWNGTSFDWSTSTGSGVTSFNTRTGAISLTSSDVTTALTYTPVSTSGTGATGTWAISISGAAASATTATTATTATNIAGGAAGSVPYQTGAGATTTLPIGTTGQVLTIAGGLPSWQTLSASTATNIAGGATNQLLYQTASGVTNFITAPTVASTFLEWTGSGFTWAATSGGVTSFNTRTGAVTLSSTDVTNALTYTPPQSNGTGASGTWGINISGSATFATSAGNASTASTASIANNVSGVVSVANGGTGSSSLLGAGIPQLSADNYFSSTSNPIKIPATASFVLGTTSDWAMRFDGASALNYSYGGTGSVKVQFFTSGAASNTTGVWGVVSDERIKENIVPARNYLTDLCKLNVVNYNIINNPQKMLGFVAQQVESVMPGLVETYNSEEYGIADFKSVKTSIMIPMLVQAIQDLKAEIDTLKAKVGA